MILRSKLGALVRVSPDEEEAAAAEEGADGRIKKKQRKQQEEEAHLKAEKTLNVVIKATELADLSSATGGDDSDDDAKASDDSSDDDSQKNVSKSQGEEPIKKHKIHNVYTVGRVIPVVRVQGLRLVEGVVIGSNMKKYVESQILHVTDVRVGQVLPVEVTEVTASGLVLSIAGRIAAFCPVAHTSDSANAESKIAKKFSVGQKLTMRVLNKSAKGRVIMTNKKSLVELPEESVFADLARIGERQETTAAVESIDERGVGVRFFSEVRGLLPLAVLTKQGVQHPQEAYRVGQLVRVLSLAVIHPTPLTDAKKKNKKARHEAAGHVLCALAFVLSEDKLVELFHAIAPLRERSAVDSSAAAKTTTSTANGKEAAAAAEFEFVSGAVAGITEESFLVRLDDGRTATLPKVQCHDFGFAAASLNVKDKARYPYKIGTRIEGALVLGTVKKQLTLTLKPLLLKAARHELGEEVIFPSDGHGVSQGSVCVGVVKKVDDFGVIVGFRGSLAALLPRSNLADRFVAADERLFAEGDVIRAVVQKVDLATQRYLLTTKPSAVPKSPGLHRYFHAYLHDRFVATQRTSQAEGQLLPDWKTYRLGTVVKATVSTVEDYGVVYLGQDQTTMMLDRGATAAATSVGKTVEVLVQDIDYEHRVLLVKALDKAAAKAFQKPNKAAVGAVGVSQEVTIERVTPQYLVVSNGAVTGFAALADFHVAHPDTSSFVVGEKVAATLQVQRRGVAADALRFPHEDVTLFALDDLSAAYGASHAATGSKSAAKQKKAAEAAAAAASSVSVEEGDLLEGELDLRKTFALEPPAFRVRLANGLVARLCFTEVSEPAQWEDYADVVALWRQWQRDDELHGDADDADEKAAVRDEHLAALRRLQKRHVAHGQTVTVRVVAVNGHRVDVSLRASRVAAEKIGQQTKADAMPAVGAVVPAYIHNVSNKGCFVRLSQTLKGRSLIKDLADTFVESPEDAFPTGRLVACRVQSVDMLKGHVSVVLKESVVHAAVANKKALQKLKAGMTVKGTVENVKDVGVFVRIDGTNVVGLARAVAALQDASKTLQEEYAAGDIVRARVLKVSPNTQRVALGLREKYFHADYEVEDVAADESDAADSAADEASAAASSSSDEEDDEASDADEAMDVDDENDDVEEDDDDESGSDEDSDEDSDAEDVVVPAKKGKAAAVAAAKAVAYDSDDVGEAVATSRRTAAGRKDKTIAATTATTTASKKKRKLSEADDDLGDLDWGDASATKKPKTTSAAASDDVEDAADAESDFGDSDSDDEDGDATKKTSAKKKDSDRKKHEKELRARELALAEGRLVPDSANDFERLVIGQPNSSFLWIQYIAFHVKNADIDAARVIANRALRTIHFREEEEKFNVWVALLNMEYRYGSRDSFDKALTQAVNESRGKGIFLSLAGTMEQARDIAGAEQLFEKALKRPQFRKSKKVWMAYHLLKLKAGDVAGAKAQLSRSLQALAPHKHVEVIRSFALAEFDHGSMDRGRVLFEELLSNYPKRNDLWNVYVDKEVKLGHVVQARQLFERMIALKVSPKVMKTVFKKYMAFESQHGDARSQELVKQKAREYVSTLA